MKKVDEVCSNLNVEKPILTIEPGRSIVGNAGITLYTIGAIKNIQGVRTYVSVDGGMTDNIRPALYGAKYEMAIANKMNEKCDILAVFSTGAYGFSMSSNYNKNPKAPVIFVKDGIVRVVSKRQSYEELLALEI